MRARTWFRGLDGLRALAVAAVVGYHFAPTAVPGGFLGVDLFFVISGYLITRLLLAEIDLTGALSIRDFYWRRARRLLPGLVVLLLVVSLAGTLVWRDQLPTLGGGLVAGLVYVSNWWQIADHQSYFVATGRPSMLQHLWSLGIEEQFYLIWPVLLALLAGVVLSRGRTVVLTSRRLLGIAGVAVVLAGASTATMAALAVGRDIPYGADSSRVYFGTDTHAMGLLLGAAAGALALRARFAPRRPLVRGAFLSDVAVLAALTVLVRTVLQVDEFDPQLYRGGFALVSLLCVVVVAGVPRRGSLVGWVLDRAPLRWLGTRSYSVYLWHWPVAVVTRPGVDLDAAGPVVLVLRLAITAGLAEASYRLVEQPFRAGGFAGLKAAWRWTNLAARPRMRLAPAAAACGLVVVGSLATLLVSASHRTSSAERGSPVLTTPPGTTAVGSVSPTPVRHTATPSRRTTPPPARQVAKPKPSPAPPPPASHGVSAFGDSVMLGAAPQLAAALPGSEVDAVEGRQARAVFADIAARRAARKLCPVVVIHTGDNGIIQASDLATTLSSLAGKRVVLVTDRVPRDWQQPNNETLRRIAGQFPNVTLVDWYRIADGHRSWFWTDGLHLRPAGAAVYAQLIAQAVRG